MLSRPVIAQKHLHPAEMHSHIRNPEAIRSIILDANASYHKYEIIHTKPFLLIKQEQRKK
ncbi:hypothetical protein BofuT4_P099270.1 [Botrytis cinerea T4]|uniref:Uncharacterized protein n=1 Tax=Botryotinia fuckeliana (strain T4) TaxID=999810 RepID=G2YCD0_BOTF4|nr:hypothetical protein BofuT4_P099270.1 [Botrytis cinerea T4]